MHQGLRRTLFALITILTTSIVFIIIVIIQRTSLPCDFIDSIDVTNGIHQPDLSIMFNNSTFTKDQYYKVNSSIRGCVCNTNPCIRLCCLPGVFFDDDKLKCQNHTNDLAKRFEQGILNRQNKTEIWILEHHFGIVYGKPCKGMFIGDYDYNLTYAGNILFENHSRSHREYCLAPIFDEDDHKINLKLLACHINDNGSELRMEILPYFMLSSVPFLMVTFLVYVSIPELRNLHGKCLLSYLICMAIGYTCMAWVKINRGIYVDPTLCQSIGYLIYFSFISAFLWSNVISYDLWWNFQKTNGFMLSERKRLILYMFFVWGLTFLLIIFAFSLNSMKSIPGRWRIGIGESTCFLKSGEHENLSRILYFYLPLCMMWATNVTFFLLTVRRIFYLQLELKAMLKNESSRHQQKLNKDKENFLLYLRLSILMGLTWIMDGISYFVSPDSLWFMATDIWNCAQGVLIFILFVLKRRVLRLIKQRFVCNCLNRQSCASTYEESKTRETSCT